MTNDELFNAAKTVLKNNHRKNHTVPAEGLYPHQWLWDSCFIAIGLRHIDVKQAQKELQSLKRGQWSNGMLPNMILNDTGSKRLNATFWRSDVSQFSPDKYQTSGITQPPMLAEAVVRVGKKLNVTERRSWYHKMYPAIVAYHQWLYEDRDSNNTGLVLQLHPWETGLDNTPPWMHEFKRQAMPKWISIVKALGLDAVITKFRKDTKYALPGERLETIDGLLLYSMQRFLRRHAYNTARILRSAKRRHRSIAIQDVAYNAIFIRANQQLQVIAKAIGKELPQELVTKIKHTEAAFEELWDEYGGQYYSRNYDSRKLIKVPSVGGLLGLYAGTISKERAALLVKLINNERQFGTNFPVPSVPVSSKWFKPHTYWQGPTWININWLIMDGLERYGYTEEAKLIRERSITLLKQSGFNEYFSPLDGTPAGAKNFSWTAALIIDMLKR